MKKLMKATLAVAVGGALLFGGAGTLASWNSLSAVSGGTIVAGNLVVSDDGTAGVWQANGTTITLAGYLIVPGDVLSYSKSMNIVATGNNLVATLSVSQGTITGTTGSAADLALAAYLTHTATVTATGTGITPSGPNFTVTAGTLGVAQTINTVTTITFPRSVTAGLPTEGAAKTGSVSLAGLTVSLTQN